MELFPVNNLNDLFMPSLDNVEISLVLILKTMPKEAWTLEVVEGNAFVRFVLKLEKNFDRCNDETKNDLINSYRTRDATSLTWRQDNIDHRSSQIVFQRSEHRQ